MVPWTKAGASSSRTSRPRSAGSAWAALEAAKAQGEAGAGRGCGGRGRGVVALGGGDHIKQHHMDRVGQWVWNGFWHGLGGVFVYPCGCIVRDLC